MGESGNSKTAWDESATTLVSCMRELGLVSNAKALKRATDALMTLGCNGFTIGEFVGGPRDGEIWLHMIDGAGIGWPVAYSESEEALTRFGMLFGEQIIQGHERLLEMEKEAAHGGH